MLQRGRAEGLNRLHERQLRRIEMQMQAARSGRRGSEGWLEGSVVDDVRVVVSYAVL